MSEQETAPYVPALIRDARGLTSLEKVFLYTVDSRGRSGMFTTAERAAEDMGVSLRTFRSLRRSLVAKGMLSVHERPPKTSVYRVRSEALATSAAPTSAAPTSAGPTSAAGAGVPVQEMQGSPVQQVQGSPVQEVHTEEEQEAEPRKGNAKTNVPPTPQAAPAAPRGSSASEDMSTTARAPGRPRFNRGLPPRAERPTKQRHRRPSHKPQEHPDVPGYTWSSLGGQCTACGNQVAPDDGLRRVRKDDVEG